MNPRILLIEDERSFARNIGTYLERYGFDISLTDTADSGMSAFRETGADLILLDYKLGRSDGLDILKSLKEQDSDARIVLMTGHGGVDVAVRAMKAGACDFITKPIALDRLRRVIDVNLSTSRPQKSTAANQPTSELIGASKAMRDLRQRIAQIACAKSAIVCNQPPSTLIIGETGTGKELVARALHSLGPRQGRPFVSINCASLPSHLVEAELFGFEKGSFTDAKASKPGLIEAAEGGVLFLDEIGDLDLSLQAKLLRVLEARSCRRIGSLHEKLFDVWIIAATNRNLNEMAAEGSFRSDLIYRLNVLTIETPPLRERIEDVSELAQHFLSVRAVQWGRPGLHLSPDALSSLSARSWPGNVRELRNTVDQSAMLTERDEIGAELVLATSGAPQVSTGSEFAIPLPAVGIDLEQTEQEFIRQALTRTRGCVTSAAKLLNVSRDTLRYRIAKFQIGKRQ